MGMISVCDGCGKQQPAVNNGLNWFKPSNWYEKSAETATGKKTIITACSRECIDKIDADRKATGLSTNGIIPF